MIETFRQSLAQGHMINSSLKVSLNAITLSWTLRGRPFRFEVHNRDATFFILYFKASIMTIRRL